MYGMLSFTKCESFIIKLIMQGYKRSTLIIDWHRVISMFVSDNYSYIEIVREYYTNVEANILSKIFNVKYDKKLKHEKEIMYN